MSEDEEFCYTVLSDESYAAAIGQFRMAVGGVLKVFDMYGMGVYIGNAQEELVRLAEDFGQRIRGDLDKPISLDYVRRKHEL